jgi:hypothetical protein
MTNWWWWGVGITMTINSDSKFGEVKLPPGSPWDWENLTDSQGMDLHVLDGNLGSKAPALQYSAVKQCRALKDNVIAGDGFDTLTCVRLCAQHGLVMPDWLANAFISKYDPVHHLQVGSWDDAESFGRPYPPKTNLKAERKKFEKAGDVWIAIAKGIEQGKSVGDDFFAEVGEKLFIEKTTVQKYYKYAKEHMGFANFVDVTDSQERVFENIYAYNHLSVWRGLNKVNLKNGVFYHTYTPLFPRALRPKRGITNGTLNSSIEPLQPKGQLNDISSVKPKPTRKTAKTPRSRFASRLFTLGSKLAPSQPR